MNYQNQQQKAETKLFGWLKNNRQDMSKDVDKLGALLKKNNNNNNKNQLETKRNILKEKKEQAEIKR